MDWFLYLWTVTDLNENNQSREKIDASLCKNSLLRHRRSLSQVLNHTKIALYTKSAGTHNTHTDGRTEVSLFNSDFLEQLGHEFLC